MILFLVNLSMIDFPKVSQETADEKSNEVIDFSSVRLNVHWRSTSTNYT